MIAMKQLPIYGADEGVHKTMDEVEQVMENMDLQPDPEVTKYLFGLFSKEALELCRNCRKNYDRDHTGAFDSADCLSFD